MFILQSLTDMLHSHLWAAEVLKVQAAMDNTGRFIEFETFSRQVFVGSWIINLSNRPPYAINITI